MIPTRPVPLSFSGPRFFNIALWLHWFEQGLKLRSNLHPTPFYVDDSFQHVSVAGEKSGQKIRLFYSWTRFSSEIGKKLFGIVLRNKTTGKSENKYSQNCTEGRKLLRNLEMLQPLFEQKSFPYLKLLAYFIRDTCRDCTLTCQRTRKNLWFFPSVFLEAYKSYQTNFGLFWKPVSNSTNISEMRFACLLGLEKKRKEKSSLVSIETKVRWQVNMIVRV